MAFDESKHPRAEDGKFTTKDGAGASTGGKDTKETKSEKKAYKKGTIGKYKDYGIDYDVYGSGEFTVQYNGDDMFFDTEEEARAFIDDIAGGDDEEEYRTTSEGEKVVNGYVIGKAGSGGYTVYNNDGHFEENKQPYKTEEEAIKRAKSLEKGIAVGYDEGEEENQESKNNEQSKTKDKGSRNAKFVDDIGVKSAAKKLSDRIGITKDVSKVVKDLLEHYPTLSPIDVENTAQSYYNDIADVSSRELWGKISQEVKNQISKKDREIWYGDVEENDIDADYERAYGEAPDPEENPSQYKKYIDEYKEWKKNGESTPSSKKESKDKDDERKKASKLFGLPF